MTSELPPPPHIALAIDSIHGSLVIISGDEHHHRNRNQDSFENARRFTAYASRLQLLLRQLFGSSPSPEDLPASTQTALRGISVELAKAAETVSSYRERSKIFVLLNCQSLCSSLQNHTVAIGSWLALIESSLQNADHLPDLRKKTADLALDMKQALFNVTKNEERVQCTLQKEGQGRPSTKAVQSAIIMDLARALGIDSDDHAELSEQVKLLKNDLARSSSVTERRILVSLERILGNWSVSPDSVRPKMDVDFEEEANILPFKNFLCPLTKEVMKEPVVLESSQTYERTAIEYWFRRCLEDGRDPTCPVTGQVLKSLELKPNIGLAGAIEEWINRNVDIQVKLAVKHLSQESLDVDCIERVLDDVYRISEEYHWNRYRVRNAGVVVLIMELLKNSSKNIGSLLRSKALMTFLSMAKDEESKKIMLGEGITRLAIHGLIGSSEKEREYAVKLLLEFSSDEAYCIKLASEKGALVLLSSMAGDVEHPSLSNLAEEVLKQLGRVEANVQHLASAGRFEPLLSRLHEGSDDVKMEMASIIGRLTLTNSSKEQIARQSARVLIELLAKPEGRAPSLQALFNLSSLDDNATILVNCAVLPALTDILFENQDYSLEWTELAASTMANIVSNPGHWELASADKKGQSMQSESMVLSLLRLLSVVSPQCQVSILHILHGIASSPQAAGSVATHLKSGDGIKIIIPFLEHPEVEHRIYAFKLTRIFSGIFGQDLANELKWSNRLSIFKDKLLDDQSPDDERSDAACILANIPLREDEVKELLGPSFLTWIVASLKNQRHSSNGRTFRPASSMVEGLLGLLLHFTRTLDPQIVSMAKEHCLMTIFHEQLIFPSNSRVKRLAAIGLKNLSEAGRSFASRDLEPPVPKGLCTSLGFICGSSSTKPSMCPIHNARCKDDYQLCLLKTNCVKPLVNLLNDQDANVQIAAVEALSTLLQDTSSTGLKRAADELEKLGVVSALINLFIEVRPGELQEKTLWMIERMLRVEGLSHQYSLNQSLVRALVEAFKHGNTNARRHAQDALTNLKQISGVSGQHTSQARERR